MTAIDFGVRICKRVCNALSTSGVFSTIYTDLMNKPDLRPAARLSTDSRVGCTDTWRMVNFVRDCAGSKRAVLRLTTLALILLLMIVALPVIAQATAPVAGDPVPAPPKVDPAPPKVEPAPPKVELAPPVAPPAVAPPVASPKPTPKQVVQSLAAAIEKGDGAAIRALVVAQGASPQLADATLALAGALRRLDAAAATRFNGAVPAGGLTQSILNVTASLKAVDAAAEKIEGDSATLTLAGGKQAVIRLKRAGDEWRVDLTPAGEDAKAAGLATGRLLKLYDLLIKAADQTSADLTGGAIGSAEEASQVFARRVLKARIEAN